MPRYAAFLRGVSPMNARMADLKACFERLGFTDVKTVLSSGNVVFSSTARSEKQLLSMIESGMLVLDSVQTVQAQGTEGVAAYQRSKNAVSIDGFDAGLRQAP